MEKIKLTQGQFALVDDADFEWLNQWKWCAWKHGNTFYVKRMAYCADTKSKQRVVYMHRLVLGLKDSNVEADHKDGNGLNNQRDNLRSSTHKQNLSNRRSERDSSSIYLGVHWRKNRNTWEALIGVGNGKVRYLGNFKKEVDAAMAYNKAAGELFGDFANLNKIKA